MIGFLRGRLIQKIPPMLVVDVQGVGYEVEAPISTFYQLPETGQEIHLDDITGVAAQFDVLIDSILAAPVPEKISTCVVQP